MVVDVGIYVASCQLPNHYGWSLNTLCCSRQVVSSAGGGWYGPYVHNQELWIELHTLVMVTWWNERGARSEAEVPSNYTIVPRLDFVKVIPVGLR